jgi:hypothetical protein
MTPTPPLPHQPPPKALDLSGFDGTLRFRLAPTSSAKDHSLIQWAYEDLRGLRSLQVDTKIAELWAASPALLSECIRQR